MSASKTTFAFDATPLACFPSNASQLISNCELTKSFFYLRESFAKMLKYLLEISHLAMLSSHR